MNNENVILYNVKTLEIIEYNSINCYRTSAQKQIPIVYAE